MSLAQTALDSTLPARQMSLSLRLWGDLGSNLSSDFLFDHRSINCADNLCKVMWDLWVRDHVRARWYTLSLISGVSKQNTEKIELCENIISFHKDLFQFGLLRNCTTMSWSLKKSSVGSNTSNQDYWDASEDVQTLMNQICGSQICREGKCVPAVGIFCCYCLAILGFFGGQHFVWFLLLRFGFLSWKELSTFTWF